MKSIQFIALMAGVSITFAAFLYINIQQQKLKEATPPKPREQLWYIFTYAGKLQNGQTFDGRQTVLSDTFPSEAYIESRIVSSLEGPVQQNIIESITILRRSQYDSFFRFPAIHTPTAKP